VTVSVTVNRSIMKDTAAFYTGATDQTLTALYGTVQTARQHAKACLRYVVDDVAKRLHEARRSQGRRHKDCLLQDYVLLLRAVLACLYIAMSRMYAFHGSNDIRVTQ
jgi:hypothetical protein